MKKIKQIPLCAALLASTAFLCCESPVNEALDTGAATVCSALHFSDLKPGALPADSEPVLSVESSLPPIVGSAWAAATEESEESEKTQPKEEKKEKKKKKEKQKKKKKKTKTTAVEYVLPPKLGLRKSLESHTAITDRGSAQYRMQQSAKTDRLGLRIYEKRYMVAIGTYFHAPVGTKIDVCLSCGATLKCVVGDIKSDSDTVGGLTQKDDGSVVEFIVEWRRIDRSCKRLGSMHALEEFGGYVEKIVVYDET